MRTLLTIISIFLIFHIQAQNWIGNQNFIELFKKSDIVLVGKITDLTKLAVDTSKYLRFRMPLQSLTVNNPKVFKGVFDKRTIYYRDIFNGCGYAPILFENILNKETLIFAELRNDSIFQIESMNESPMNIANSIIEYYNYGPSLTSKQLTDWFFESLKNDDLFQLLNHNISFKQSPIYNSLESINFSVEQRNWIYEKLLSFDKYSYDNEGIISILVKYKDDTYKKLLKNYLIKLANEPYSNVDDLMLNIYLTSENNNLKKIIQKFKKDWRENTRKKLIQDFISRI